MNTNIRTNVRLVFFSGFLGVFLVFLVFLIVLEAGVLMANRCVRYESIKNEENSPECLYRNPGSTSGYYFVLIKCYPSSILKIILHTCNLRRLAIST